MKAVLILAVIGASIGFVRIANAEDKAAINSNTLFGSFGWSSSKSVTPNSCKVTMSLNKRDFIRRFPALQKLGLMNSDITQTRINLQPNLLAMGFAVQMLPVVTKELYEENGAADKCQFVMFLQDKDDYGNDERVEMFSYKFSRSLKQRINWDDFEAPKMLKIAPDFQFSPEFMARVQQERE